MNGFPEFNEYIPCVACGNHIARYINKYLLVADSFDACLAWCEDILIQQVNKINYTMTIHLAIIFVL